MTLTQVTEHIKCKSLKHAYSYNAEHFYHFQIIITGSMSENVEMGKIVHLHGFQHPKLKVYPAPEVHDSAVGCIDF